MRKIYSLVLMATMLLVGTNAWATDVATVTKGGSTQGFETLPQAFASVSAGETATITLLDNVELSEVILINGGNDNSDDGKRITLNMGDENTPHTITGTDRTKCIFVLTKGYFEITGNGVITYQDINVNHGEKWIKNDCGVCVAVMGSVDPTASDWSHLVVGAGVTLEAAYAAVQLQAENTSATYGLANNTYWTKWVDGSTLTSNNTTLDDIWNHCNDISRIPSEVTGPDRKATIAQINGKYTKQRPGTGVVLGFGYGINVDIFGTLRGRLYGLQIKGQITATPKIPWQNDEAKFPKINVHPGSEIWADAANTNEFPGEGKTGYKQPTAIYASGYAIWNIQGHVEGANGVYVKMGEIVVEGGAVVKSNATDTVEMHHTSSGVSGAGNAITLQSDWSDGTMGITIKSSEGGTPRIESSAEGGAAIVETATIPNNPESQVQNITIEGGNFSGDVNGCVVISDNFDGDISVSGGTYTGSIETLIEAMEDDSTSIIQTVVAQDGNTATVVIGQKAEGDVVVPIPENEEVDFSTVNANSIVKLRANSSNIAQTLSADVTMKYLSLTGTGSYTATVTIPYGKTMTVDQIVMDANGRIIVQAGGKLVVTGTNGIFADDVNNLVLEAVEGNQSIFLFNPNVKTNRNPKATVEFVSESYKRVSPVTEYRYQFFCPPMKGGIVESISAKASDNNTTYKSQLDVWRNGAWDRIGIMNSGTPLDMSKFNIPFGFYSIVSNNPPEVKMTYTIQGSLVGNTAPELPLYAGWTAISNAFTGDINAVMLWNYMLARKQAGSNIEASVYTYTIEGNTMVWNASNPLAWATQEIEPMNAFMFKNNGATEQIALSYGDLVWTPATSAPARLKKFSNLTRVMMHVKGENGVLDRLTIAQSSDFTEERDIYDAEQYINEDINFYVTDDEKYAIFATDNLNNTYLGFSCVNGGNFTLTFDNVEGEELYLLDMNNNTVVAMVNGDSYQFTAADGETNDYRFKVIGRQEMPTEVEILEDNTIQRVGIYTLTGQYLGEMNVWNSLPAGLYIVNGEKKIK